MSKTIQIPGGTAELFEPRELTPRRNMPARSIVRRADDLMFKIIMARRITDPNGETVDENEHLDGPELRLTPHEAEMLEHLKYASAWAFLKSWTLDLPFPETWEAMLDLPQNVADAIVSATDNIGSADVAAQMELTKETIENKESFTGSSAALPTSSKAKGKRRSSPRKRSNSSGRVAG